MVKPIPEGYHCVTPYLILSGASEAIAFYTKALGASEVMRMDDPSGKIHHAEIKIGDSRIMLADGHPEIQALSPKTIGGSPVSLRLYVEDVDAAVERAVAAGAKLVRPVADPVLRRPGRRDRGPVRLSLVYRHAQGGSDDGGDPPPRRCTGELALQTGWLQGHIQTGNKKEIAMDDKTRTELEAATFRRLVEHLRERTDVQNIDLMNLAGFCRNCLSKWYRAEAEDRGLALSDPESREIVYGMPYDEWRAKHQKEASAEQKAAFAASQKH